MSDPASEATGIVPDGRYPRRTPERAIAIAAALRAARLLEDDPPPVPWTRAEPQPLVQGGESREALGL